MENKKELHKKTYSDLDYDSWPEWKKSIMPYTVVVDNTPDGRLIVALPFGKLEQLKCVTENRYKESNT